MPVIVSGVMCTALLSDCISLSVTINALAFLSEIPVNRVFIYFLFVKHTVLSLVCGIIVMVFWLNNCVFM